MNQKQIINISEENISLALKLMIIAIIFNVVFSLIFSLIPVTGKKIIILKQIDDILRNFKINQRRLFSSSFIISLIIFLSVIFVNVLDFLPFINKKIEINK